MCVPSGRLGLSQRHCGFAYRYPSNKKDTHNVCLFLYNVERKKIRAPHPLLPRGGNTILA